MDFTILYEFYLSMKIWFIVEKCFDFQLWGWFLGILGQNWKLLVFFIFFFQYLLNLDKNCWLGNQKYEKCLKFPHTLFIYAKQKCIVTSLFYMRLKLEFWHNSTKSRKFEKLWWVRNVYKFLILWLKICKYNTRFLIDFFI